MIKIDNCWMISLIVCFKMAYISRITDLKIITNEAIKNKIFVLCLRLITNFKMGNLKVMVLRSCSMLQCKERQVYYKQRVKAYAKLSKN